MRTAQQIIEAQVGNLVVNNASLQSQNDELKEKIQQLENEIAQLKSNLVRGDAKLAGRITKVDDDRIEQRGN